MTTPRENLLRTLRREGFDSVPVDFVLCEHQIIAFKKRFEHDDYETYFGMSHRPIELAVKKSFTDGRALYKRELLPEDTEIDELGVGHSKGSELAFHMTRMHHPLQGADLEEIKNHPFPTVDNSKKAELFKTVKSLHEKGLAAFGFMPMTIWEASWYLRSMEEIMADMVLDKKNAEILFDKSTAYACEKASTYAEAGVDILSIGDDVGAQSAPLIAVKLWEEWLKPRLIKVISTARSVKPDILIFYHSCGYVTPFIDGLIEAGVDILNPIQAECMDFNEIHDMAGDRISFWGTLGTQKLLPFDTPDEVRKTTISRLEKCGEKGGIVIGPTHMVEPEVPWENLTAIIEAVKDFENKRK